MCFWWCACLLTGNAFLMACSVALVGPESGDTETGSSSARSVDTRMGPAGAWEVAAPGPLFLLFSFLSPSHPVVVRCFLRIPFPISSSALHLSELSIPCLPCVFYPLRTLSPPPPTTVLERRIPDHLLAVEARARMCAVRRGRAAGCSQVSALARSDSPCSALIGAARVKTYRSCTWAEDRRLGLCGRASARTRAACPHRPVGPCWSTQGPSRALARDRGRGPSTFTSSAVSVRGSPSRVLSMELGSSSAGKPD
ncbi:hypothetical protein C2E23DRAFT_356712 [Lenzites betulinus]|nr:hypothetical protein C2E23DRAFT_356712 [Lenzites betulinus]